jgi:hypothetical protein
MCDAVVICLWTFLEICILVGVFGIKGLPYLFIQNILGTVTSAPQVVIVVATYSPFSHLNGRVCCKFAKENSATLHAVRLLILFSPEKCTPTVFSGSYLIQ